MYRFKRILYSFGGRPLDDPGLVRAARIAEDNDALLTLAVVLPSPGDMAGVASRLGIQGLGDAVQDERARGLEALAATLEPDLRVRTRVLHGDPAGAVIEEARESRQDLVMAGAEGPKTLRSRFFGGSDRHLMRSCPCPVWILDPSAPGSLSNVLAAVDVSGDGPPRPLTLKVLQIASSLAEREGARLHLVHAVDLFGDSILRSPTRGMSRKGLATVRKRARAERQERIEALLATALLRPGGLHDITGPERPGAAGRGDTGWEREVAIHVHRGEPAFVISEVSRRVGADVLVMGHRGRSGLPGLLIGNVAEQVIDRVRCGVLSVRLRPGHHPEHDAPPEAARAGQAPEEASDDAEETEGARL